jgi:formylglycine-generating enzyme required for sulfatase activity
MAPYRHWLNPLLRDALAQPKNENDPRAQLHASLALLPVDSGMVEYLYGWLLKAQPQELIVIRQGLFEHKHDLTERLWSILENPKNDQDQRLRAACALASYAPDDPRWKKVCGDVAVALASQEPSTMAQWTNALEPGKKWLIQPLAELLTDENRNLSMRRMLAKVYSTYAPNIPDAYTRLEKQLNETTARDASVDTKIALAKRQASVGVALLVMGRGEKVWPLLRHRPDPTLRSYLIDWLRPGGVNAKVLIARLYEEPDVTVRRAILLSLGEYGQDRLSQDQRLNIGRRQWYITSQGQTMVVVANPGDFLMGEGKERHRQQISHSFAIASKEVTVEQFLRFRKSKEYAPTGECPVNAVTWYDAAAYCNWLSAQEGIPMDQLCYAPDKDGRYGEGMRIVANYLLRKGYRLPTEAEWEYACRAGADTGYSFGEPVELLRKYAWYAGNSPGRSQPGGMLRPNDFGLFDMHGNALEWCQSAFTPVAAEYRTGDGTSNGPRVLRGGWFGSAAGLVRSAYRDGRVPTLRDTYVGFRPARTIAP